MMPMTPSGTRICPISIPEACFWKAEIFPIGSSKETICSRPKAMVSIVFRVIVRRSTNAASCPFAFARSTSTWFTFWISAAFWRTSFAICKRAWFFCSADARAISRDALRARFPISCINSWIFKLIPELIYLASWTITAINFPANANHPRDLPAVPLHANPLTADLILQQLALLCATWEVEPF